MFGNPEDANTKKEEAIFIARKVLRDIGEWDYFVIEKAFYVLKDRLHKYDHWIVSFQFSEHDFHDGIVTPRIIVNDKEKRATQVSWKKAIFKLHYDCEKDLYTKLDYN